MLQNPLQGVEIFTVLKRKEKKRRHLIENDLHDIQDPESHQCNNYYSHTHNRLHVLEGDWLTQHHLVEGPNEESCEVNKYANTYKDIYW